MKYLTVKCARWPLPWLSRLIYVPAAILFFALSAQAQRDFIQPPIGGDGGGQFINRCPQGQLLTGLELRTGDDVDAIRPICVTAYAPTDVGPPVAGGIWSGGDGGSPRQLVCPKETPIVTGMYVGYGGVDTVIVNHIHLFCGIASPNQEPSEVPSAKFDGSGGRSTVGLFGGRYAAAGEDTQRCLADPVAVGINGRSGKWLDAVGLICGQPTESVKTLGRVKGAAPTPGPPVSLCERAREARARNSPTAPALEERCRAAGAAGEKVPLRVVPRETVKEKDPSLIGALNPRSSTIKEQDPRSRGVLNPRSSTITDPKRTNVPVLNSILVQVKYRKEYGYRNSSNVFAPGPSSCGGFSVSAYQILPGRPRRQFRMSDTDFKMTEADGYYVCNFVFNDLPLHQEIRVLANVTNDPFWATAAWEGGSDAQPPTGQQRRIQEENGTVTLTEAQPRVTLVFEMIYAPPPLR